MCNRGGTNTTYTNTKWLVAAWVTTWICPASGRSAQVKYEETLASIGQGGVINAS